jgi:hypothetical protein
MLTPKTDFDQTTSDGKEFTSHFFYFYYSQQLENVDILEKLLVLI